MERGKKEKRDGAGNRFSIVAAGDRSAPKLNTSDTKKAFQLFKCIMDKRNDGPKISAKLKSFIGDCHYLDLKQHDEAMTYYKMAIDDDSSEAWPSIMIAKLYTDYKNDCRTAVDILENVMARGIPVLRLKRDNRGHPN